MRTAVASAPGAARDRALIWGANERVRQTDGCVRDTRAHIAELLVK